MKLDKMVLANAFGLATAILWTLCSAFVLLFPAFSTTISNWWMHGLDISVLGVWNLTVANFIWGGVTLVISAWITGWVFGWSWEMASKRQFKLT